MIYTTLNKIRAHRPCANGWTKLLHHLGKTQADDEPLALATIIDSNGLDDALWCLCAVDGHQREMRLYAVWCARQVQHLMTDPRSLAALDVAERYAHGQATDEELSAARAAARVAAEDAARAAARKAAWEAAWGAARSAVWHAAGAVAPTAWHAARAAAWDAAGDAAQAAAWDAQAAEFRRVFCNNETPITDDHGKALLPQYQVIERSGNWLLVYDQMQVGERVRHEFRIQKLRHDVALYPGITLAEAQKRFRARVEADNE